MDEQKILSNLSRVVRFLKILGLEKLELSEILSLRRYIIQAEIKQEGCGLWHDSDYASDAVYRHLHEFYGIDYFDLFERENGRPTPPSLSNLVSRDGFHVDVEFKEYFGILQRRLFFP